MLLVCHLFFKTIDVVGSEDEKYICVVAHRGYLGELDEFLFERLPYRLVLKERVWP